MRCRKLQEEGLGMKSFAFLLATLTACVLSVGCNDADSKTAAPISAAESPQPAAAPAPSGSFTGVVLETMDAGGYTYVHVDTGTEKIWAATRQFQVKVGDQLIIPAGMPMNNFHSNTLNRDFARIYFTSGIRVVGGQKPASVGQTQLPKGHPPLPGPMASQNAPSKTPRMPEGHPPLTTSTGTATFDFSGIEKAVGGKTVAEVFAAKQRLAGQEVAVRGKVVKFNPNIMGVNWLHVRDGTGSQGTDDLTVTTNTKVQVGDTVLIRGTVAIDKDFGAGYTYPVIVEKAQVTVEPKSQ
jgi:hypothetical protein